MEKSGERSASVVDLFCGAGSLAYGFATAGLRATAGIDTDESCRYAFESNTGSRFICKSVGDLAPDGLSRLYSGCGRRVLIGCAPCQPFSSYNKNRSLCPQRLLLNAFARLVCATSPDVVSMENVPRLRPRSISGKFVRRLKGEGYSIWHGVLSCPDYVVLQTGLSLVLLVSGPGGIGMIGRTHRGGSPHSARRHTRSRSLTRPMRLPKGSTPPVARAVRGQPRVHLAGPPVGGWKNGDRRLVPPYHRRKSWRSCGGVSWNLPAPRMTTQAAARGSGRFGHPDQDRAPSLGASALIQTSPRGYKFAPGRSGMRINAAARHIGNAVPVAHGNAIAMSIKRHMVGHDGRV